MSHTINHCLKSCHLHPSISVCWFISHFQGQTFLLTESHHILLHSPWVSTFFSCFNLNLGWHEKKMRGMRLGSITTWVNMFTYFVRKINETDWPNWHIKQNIKQEHSKIEATAHGNKIRIDDGLYNRIHDTIRALL